MVSGRGDVEFAGPFVPVASLAVSFVCERIFWNPVHIKVLEDARAMAGINIHIYICTAGIDNIARFCLYFRSPDPGSACNYVEFAARVAQNGRMRDLMVPGTNLKRETPALGWGAALESSGC